MGRRDASETTHNRAHASASIARLERCGVPTQAGYGSGILEWATTATAACIQICFSQLTIWIAARPWWGSPAVALDARDNHIHQRATPGRRP